MKASALIIPAIGIGLIAMLIRKKQKTAEKLRYLPQGVRITGKFPNYKVNFLIDVTNPNDESLKVNSVFADVSVGDQVIGKVEQTAGFEIKGERTTSLSLPVIISTGNIPALVSIVAKIIKGEKGLIAKVKGEVNAEGTQTEIDQSFKLTKV